MKTIGTFIKDILKGIVIGLANVIPGVSGGTMMVVMGIYDKLIHCLSHFFKEFKKNILFLLPIIIGMLIAIFGGSVVIKWCFDRFPFPTTLFFIGLILGGLPMMVGKVKGNKIRFGHLIAFALFFALVIAMALLSGMSGQEAVLTTKPLSLLLLFLVGVVAAGTMVIPGVSGSLVLLILGYYNPVIGTISQFMSALKGGDKELLLQSFVILLVFGVGVLVGIVGFAKLIEMIFQKFELYAYWAIIGLIVASPIGILMMANFGVLTVGPVLVGVVCLVVGCLIAYKLGG